MILLQIKHDLFQKMSLLVNIQNYFLKMVEIGVDIHLLINQFINLRL